MQSTTGACQTACIIMTIKNHVLCACAFVCMCALCAHATEEDSCSVVEAFGFNYSFDYSEVQ